MQGKLIAELREWIDNRELYTLDYDGNPTVIDMGFVKAQEEVKEILSRHEAEQGEGLRERLEGYLFMLDKSGFDSDKEYAKEIRRRCLAPTTPTKPTEPLAVGMDKRTALAIVEYETVRAAHRPFKPCMEGCEHAQPHICGGNECLEHEAAECVRATCYGYKVESKEYPTFSDKAKEARK